ncbi:DUF2093 domain-containing protein [Novosphingobium sp.]|uniref:DUF2093 domain-containing protein n=1 Tax=Novosphingobium sp. TaxID=1874826 RepID=UPI0027341E38|nr:DUF2093 domain-containing protein [Novosphingobium sp.]MDP3906320.1 DUF2093 domain-containing protein [Novosphingobium sp.]
MLMSQSDRAATLFYQPNGFRVLTPGKYVTCAMSGEPILLDALRYWSVDHQEAYATSDLASRRLLGGA